MSTTPDWATDRALEIIRDVRGVATENAVRLVAAHLMVTRSEGMMAATEHTSKLLDEAFGRGREDAA